MSVTVALDSCVMRAISERGSWCRRIKSSTSFWLLVFMWFGLVPRFGSPMGSRSILVVENLACPL